MKSTTRSFLILLTLLSVGVAYAVGSWGKPVSGQLRLLEKLDSNRDGQVDIWRFDSSGNGLADFVEIDSDHDGQVDRLQVGNPETSVLDLSEKHFQTNHRTLAVCLDGVPYEVMAALWDQGYFREFSRPAKLISAFPSLSDVALTEVLHADKPPGYENLYFDINQNTIAGGALTTVSKERIPYLEMLNYDEPGIFKGLAYVLPIKTYRADLGRFLEKYSASDLPYYTAHICSTDSICHLMTNEQFATYLLEVEVVLRQIFFSQRGSLDFLVFSDHGNSQVPSRRLPVEAFLGRSGFRVESSIKDEKSVVIPAFGLVGAMVIYSQSHNTENLARILSSCEGVDFCTYMDQERIRIVSSTGTALILAQNRGRLLKYEMETGDPLELAPILERLSQEGKLRGEGFVSNEDWFEATVEHQFPDAINALFRGINNHVTHRANLLVSLKDGYHYGSTLFERIVTLRSTHGSLRKSSMTGFYMRNRPTGGRTLPARLLKDLIQ